MRAFSKTFLFFFILILLLDGISQKIEIQLLENDSMVQTRNKSSFRIMREPENSLDVIVVGDSLSYSSISPMQLWKEHGISAYVCGQSGQMVQETYHMLETTFETQSPKLIIMETNALFRGQPGIGAIKENIEEFGNYYIPIFKGHDIWKTYVTDKKYVEENFKGFSFRCEVNPYDKGKYMFETEEKEVILGNVRSYMDSIIKLCSDNGAQLLLLGTPSPASYNYKRHNSINDLANKNGLTFLDLNLKIEELGINWKTDSLDKGDHLNLSGAEKVTKYLGSFIKENYNIENHRDEAAYSSWNEELAKYDEKAIEYLKVIRKNDE